MKGYWAGALILLIAAAGCGGGGSSSTTSLNSGGGQSTVANSQSIVVNSGPANNYVNGLFTSVTVCISGTTSCQTISGVLVDTGSSGLRVLSSALALTLPQEAGPNSTTIAECNEFQDGFTWGSVSLADVQLAGETATSIPIQVIGDGRLSSVPAACTNTGLVAEDTLATLGANGVLGVGSFRQDCGGACALATASNPGLYYNCTGTNCLQAPVTLSQQVQNPVWKFPADNNGVIIQLPAVPSAGSPSVTGTLTFGIGTQSNNSLGSAKVYGVSANGTFTTTFAGRSLPNSFIDSGSNGLFFLDSTSTSLPLCSNSNSFYCPTSPQSFTATVQGANGTSTQVPFSVANANSLINNLSLNAFSNLAGPDPGSFDWGLPFFFGRTVFTAIEGQQTAAGIGPYWAF